MLKTLTTASVLLLAIGAAQAQIPINTCQLGQTCQIPIASNGFVGFAQFEIPSPYVGNYHCQFYSSNPTQLKTTAVSVAVYGGNIDENMPAIVPYNSVPLTSGSAPTSFKVDWLNPNKPHPFFDSVVIETSNANLIDPSTKLTIICNKN